MMSPDLACTYSEYLLFPLRHSIAVQKTSQAAVPHVNLPRKSCVRKCTVQYTVIQFVWWTDAGLFLTKVFNHFHCKELCVSVISNLKGRKIRQTFVERGGGELRRHSKGDSQTVLTAPRENMYILNSENYGMGV